MASLLSICGLVLISKILQPGRCHVHQAMFRKHQQKYLAYHVINKKHADTESKCLIHCVGGRSCSSVNFKTFGADKGLCEFNASLEQIDSICFYQYNLSSMLTPRHEYLLVLDTCLLIIKIGILINK